MNKLYFSFIMVVFFGFFQKTVGQGVLIPAVIDSTKLYRVEMNEGSVFIGNVIGRDSISLKMKTSSIPMVHIAYSSIKSFVAVDAENYKKGEYWFPNPHASRYLFGPTAFSLQRGDGYYQNTYLLLNSFNYGVTDHFTFGGGVELMSLFGGFDSDGSDPIIFITPKYTWNLNPKWNVGTGIIYASLPDFGADGSRSGVGIAYGIATYGNIEHNITGGLGWGFEGDEFNSKPIITISGMSRIASKAALVSENWLIPVDGYYGIYSYGLRFFGEKLAVDLALLNNKDIAEEIFIGIPYIDLVVKF